MLTTSCYTDVMRKMTDGCSHIQIVQQGSVGVERYIDTMDGSISYI